MTPADWHRLRDLLDQALQHPASQRPAFLDAACADAPALRDELEALLAAHERAEATDAFASPFARAHRPAPLEEDTEEGERVGPYRLVRLLGRGGMGTVYLAERDDGQFRQTVALKLIRRGLDTDDLLSRFAFERQILAGLDHPHIARLYDGGVTEDGRPYFAMEHVEGVPLTDYCDARRLSTQQRLALFRTVCRAVQHAHQNLVVHRDLKPSNILVTEDGTVKLLDFGIAKLLEEEGLDEGPARPQTRTGVHLLTPEYAAPEQVRGAAITTATDVYQLGVLLYELLTGHRPYRLPSRVQYEIARVILEEEPERPSTAVGRTEARVEGTEHRTPETVSQARATDPGRLQRRLAGDLDVICLTALKKEPMRRYASVEALAEDVRRHLVGLPVTARPDTFGYRASRFVRRNRVGVIAASVVALAVLVGAGLALWQARVAAEERDRARVEATKAERINVFLQEMLASANPYGHSRAVTVLEALDAAGTHAGTDLADEPEIQAAVYRTLGLTYVGLARYDTAATHLQQALALRRQTLGEDHLDVAQSLYDLAFLHHDTGDYDAADSLYQLALARYRILQPTPDRAFANVLGDYGRLQMDRGEYAQSIETLEESLALLRRLVGEENQDVATALNNIAMAYDWLGDYDQAERLYREALAMTRRTAGDEFADVPVVMNNLAFIVQAKGDYEEARTLWQGSLDLRRKIFGHEHPSVGTALLNLGGHLLLEEHYDAAEQHLREALELFQRTLPHGHPRIPRALTGLARSLTAQGRASEAEPYLREALTLQREALAADHQLVAATEEALGNCLAAQARFAEAEPLLLHNHEVVAAQLGATHQKTLDALGSLVALYKAWGKPEETARYQALAEE